MSLISTLLHRGFPAYLSSLLDLILTHHEFLWQQNVIFDTQFHGDGTGNTYLSSRISVVNGMEKRNANICLTKQSMFYPYTFSIYLKVSNVVLTTPKLKPHSNIIDVILKILSRSSTRWFAVFFLHRFKV